LVESLLNFARLEAGELEYRFEAVSPGSFIGDLVRDVQEEIRARGVRIELVGDDPRLPAIRADRELLSLVFWNLLDNAVKYSPDERQVRVEIESSGGYLVVRVRDRGMGIPAAERQEIFRKFVRGAAAKTASIKGTGIGLAMAREIVRAHGGEISVESEVGVGSTFTVLLPARASDSGLRAPVVPRPQPEARSLDPEAWSPQS
jgi:signal transduction histidine kinase